jgi:hypothetical protein
MVMNNNCTQCLALWREYAAITHAHFALESKLQLARLDHDHMLVKQLLTEAQAVAERRSELRQKIQEHEQVPHPNGHALQAEV